MKLYVQERGCYHKQMKYSGTSDMQNFRVCCEVFPKNDDRVVFFEFMEGRCDFNRGKLIVDASYTDENHNTWRLDTEKEFGVKSSDYEYTRAGVLAFINAITGENYTEIVPYHDFYVHEHYKNWTGSGLMVQWARDHKGTVDNVSVINSYGSTWMVWDGNLWEWEKVEAEHPITSVEYPDIIFCMNRVTDEERAARIIANGVEVINTMTA